MIDIKALKESNKVRVYAKIPSSSNTQAKNSQKNSSTKESSLSEQVTGLLEKQFGGEYVDFYNEHRAPGIDPEFKGDGSFEKVFEAYTNMGDGFHLDFNDFANGSQLVDFSPGSFGMGVINLLSTVGNFMPVLDIPLMQTYTGIKNFKIPINCYLDLEEWKERNADYIEDNGISSMGIVNYCYNYPLLRLMSLVLPYRNAKFGTSFDKYADGTKAGETALKAAYEEVDGKQVFNAKIYVDTLAKKTAGNSFVQNMNSKEGQAEMLSTMGKKNISEVTEADLRSYMANPSNYSREQLEGTRGEDGKDAGDVYWWTLGIVSAEITDTEHGSDNSLIQLLKYVGKGVNWILEQGKGALDTFVGDIYYLRPPFPYQKLADTKQKGLTVLYGSKRFDDVVLSGVGVEIPSGFYEGGVPSKIGIRLEFTTRRMPTLNMFDGLLMKHDPLHQQNRQGGGIYDETIADISEDSDTWRLPSANNAENVFGYSHGVGAANNNSDIVAPAVTTNSGDMEGADSLDNSEDEGGLILI